MKILAIETSGKTFSVALSEDGKIAGEIFWQAGINHSEKLVPAIDYMLRNALWDKNSIDKVAVTTGPGSFTGIRVGVSCARIIAQKLNIKIAGIDTLEVIKAGVSQTGCLVFPAIDALRNEAYIKTSKGSVEIICIEKLASILNGFNTKVLLAGSAAVVYSEELKKKISKNVVLAQGDINLPRAGVLVSLAANMKGSKYNDIKPVYVRKSWAEEKVSIKKDL